MDTVDRIFNLVDKKYAEQQKFALDLGVSTTMVSAWRKRKSTSYQKRLPEIADLLGVSVDYLLTGGQNGDSANKEYIPKLRSIDRLRGVGDKLTPEMDKQIASYIDFLIQQEENGE